MGQPDQQKGGTKTLAGPTASGDQNGGEYDPSEGPDMGRPDQRAVPAGSTTSEWAGGGAKNTDLVAELLAQGAGRRRLAAQLGISEHTARQLITATKNGDGRWAPSAP
jgi:hypothetical protein